MREVQLNPEKITHPFQLMAAWFAMLLILVGILLTGAARIENPNWVPGFLVISCVALSVLVMAAVFAMLTRFRPHLQGPKEYAEWVKDERKYRIQTVRSVEIQEVPNSQGEAQTGVNRYLLKRDPSPDPSRYEIYISDLPGSELVLKSLHQLGLQAHVYHEEDGRRKYNKKSQLAAIWLGYRVPPHVATPAIKAVTKVWPHLRYVSISGDRNEEPPDRIHDQIFFGGATSTAIDDGLKPWTANDFESIPNDLSIEELHRLIRASYSRPLESVEPTL